MSTQPQPNSRRQQYAKEKIAEWKDAFQIFDLDGKGKISAEELSTVLNNLGKPADIDHAKAIIKQVDKDGDGMIEFDEFCDMMDKQEAVLPDIELREAFNLCDRDNSGTISFDELYYVMTSLLNEKVSQDDVKAMMKEADIDHNGELSFDEFKTIMQALK